MSDTVLMAGSEELPELEVDYGDRQRRLTVLVRLLLLIPQFVVLILLGIVTFFVVIIGWFAALILGRLPGWAREFLLGYLGYSIRVNAYYQLLVDRYPPFAFAAPDYPVRISVPEEPLNRLAVLFRLILAVPAWIVSSVIGYGWGVCSFICWLAVLVMGRTPAPLFQATAAVVRYSMRYQAYMLLLTGRYPKRLFGDPDPAAGAGPRGAGEGPPVGTRPLVIVGASRVVLIIFVVVGALAFLGSGASSNNQQQSTPGYSAHR